MRVAISLVKYVYFLSYNLKEMYCTVPEVMVINYCCTATKQDELSVSPFLCDDKLYLFCFLKIESYLSHQHFKKKHRLFSQDNEIINIVIHKSGPLHAHCP